MEHNTDLEQILLSGLPEDERDHVVQVIGATRAAKLARLRAGGARGLRRDADRISRDLDTSDEDDDELYGMG